MTPLREQIEYAAVAALLRLCRVLPQPLVYGLFSGLGTGMYAVLASRRKLALRNIGIAFPEKSPADRRHIAKKTFANLTESLAFNTLVISGRISNERMNEHVVTDDWERIEHLISTAEKGVLVCSAHFGNWELMLQYSAMRLGKPVHAIARESDNRLIEERIVTPLRARFGLQIFFKKNAFMKIMQAVRKGELAGVMIDQRLNPPAGIPIEFFGRETGTASAPAMFQLRFGLTVFMIFMVKIGPQKYRLLLREPAEWIDNGKPLEEQVAELTRQHQKILEDLIHEYPDQWFWVHNRWGLPKADR